mgnify:CR=1 FL=1
MCEISEKIFNEGKAEGRAEGRTQGREEEKRETAIILFKMGMSIEKIAEAVRSSIKLVQKWVSGNENRNVSPAR